MTRDDFHRLGPGDLLMGSTTSLVLGIEPAVKDSYGVPGCKTLMVLQNSEVTPIVMSMSLYMVWVGNTCIQRIPSPTNPT